jgi:hypothetical protein
MIAKPAACKSALAALADCMPAIAMAFGMRSRQRATTRSIVTVLGV